MKCEKVAQEGVPRLRAEFEGRGAIMYIV